MRIVIDDRVAGDYPDLEIHYVVAEGLTVEWTREDLDLRRRKIEQRVRDEYTPQTLKDDPKARAYRDFFWSLMIDPTKTRPAAEALIRRILNGKPIPTINTAVDAYNIASIITGIAFAAFDMALLNGDMTLRYAEPGEEFLGIGMPRPKVLEGLELVIDDGEDVVAIYPYRDADASKITLDTVDIFILGCGVPGIGGDELESATELAFKGVYAYCTR
jgi:DNA/RNA-binding domain of Phe-tRNA-synthetase-like protein